ncbi:ASCH domain-containing protein [Thalassotalea sp. ND16A]|uniref:ASCH domain-containing protein n=1 Tax=Thalassotalea sp. ND16A TaxID=1535422 RepID=UPI00051D6BBB|nr:ASCH domain-containing protein [Thalassotalea sp. ND16A]KGJ92089.1 hypothetical protein ND16A_1783 [Thalassotalea sp. ND16A]
MNKNINTGLVIADPYVSQILSGEKTWEMRSQRTAKRETIALIKKGSGQIWGSAKIVDCIGPLSFSELIQASGFHGISKQQVEAGLLDKWNYAWVLEDIQVFEQPKAYNHPSGAVIWVDLAKALHQRNEPKPLTVNKGNVRGSLKNSEIQFSRSTNQISVPVNTDVPYAKDGTYFGKHLFKKGWYTVGEKGDEQKFSSYEQAISYLKKMKTAKWLRPNPKGNWGIVS